MALSNKNERAAGAGSAAMRVDTSVAPTSAASRSGIDGINAAPAKGASVVLGAAEAAYQPVKPSLISPVAPVSPGSFADAESTAFSAELRTPAAAAPAVADELASVDTYDGQKVVSDTTNTGRDNLSDRVAMASGQGANYTDRVAIGNTRVRVDDASSSGEVPPAAAEQTPHTADPDNARLFATAFAAFASATSTQAKEVRTEPEPAAPVGQTAMVIAEAETVRAPAQRVTRDHVVAPANQTAPVNETARTSSDSGNDFTQSYDVWQAVGGSVAKAAVATATPVVASDTGSAASHGETTERLVAFATTSPLMHVEEVHGEGFSDEFALKVRKLESDHPGRSVVLLENAGVFSSAEHDKITDIPTPDTVINATVTRPLALYVSSFTTDDPELTSMLIADAAESENLQGYDGIVIPSSERNAAGEPVMTIGLFEHATGAQTGMLAVSKIGKDALDKKRAKLKEVEQKQREIAIGITASVGPLASALLSDIRLAKFDGHIHTIDRTITVDLDSLRHREKALVEEMRVDAKPKRSKGTSNPASDEAGEEEMQGKISRAPLVKAIAEQVLQELKLKESGKTLLDVVEFVFDPEQTEASILERYDAKPGDLTQQEIDQRRTVIGYKWKTTEEINPQDIAAHTQKLVQMAQEANEANQSMFDQKGIVFSVVNKLKHTTPIEEADLIQLGMIGLLKAAYGYDGTRGIPFYPYAVLKIRGEIQHDRRKERVIVMPRDLINISGQVQLARKALEVKYPDGRLITPAMIAEEAKLPEEKVAEYIDYVNRGFDPLRLDDTNEDGASIGEWLNADKSFEDQLLDKIGVQGAFWNDLTERERTLFIGYALEGKSQSVLASETGYTQMHISRLLSGVYEKLGVHIDLARKESPGKQQKSKVTALLASWHEGKEPDYEALNQQLAEFIDSPRLRRILLEIYLGNLTNEEAAQIFGITAGGINTMIKKGYNKLLEHQQIS